MFRMHELSEQYLLVCYGTRVSFKVVALVSMFTDEATKQLAEAIVKGRQV